MSYKTYGTNFAEKAFGKLQAETKKSIKQSVEEFCPICGKKTLQTKKTKQLKGGDEGTSIITRCINCGTTNVG